MNQRTFDIPINSENRTAGTSIFTTAGRAKAGVVRETPLDLPTLTRGAIVLRGARDRQCAIEYRIRIACGLGRKATSACFLFSDRNGMRSSKHTHLCGFRGERARHCESAFVRRDGSEMAWVEDRRESLIHPTRRDGMARPPNSSRAPAQP